MGNKTWFPNGVASPPEDALTPDTIERIETLLKDKGFPPPAISAFLGELDNAQIFYFGANIAEDGSKPSDVRENLKNTLSASVKLSDQLRNLDQNSTSLITEYFGNHFDRFRALASKAPDAIRKAISDAESYPSSGRLPNYPLHLMALRVRYGIEKHLGVKATSTKPSRLGALFDEILSEMVRAIRREESRLQGKPFDEDQIPDVHKLTLRAVKGIIDETGDIPPSFTVHTDNND